jgi:hypothetical protein
MRPAENHHRRTIALWFSGMMLLVSSHFDRASHSNLPPPNYYFLLQIHYQLLFTKRKRKLPLAGGRLTQGTVMNEKVDQVEREVEGLDCVNLGDATEETKQIAPAHITPDSTYVMGWPTR